MLYLIAFFCPPIALVLCGRPLSAILNLLWIFAGFLTIGVFSILGLIFVPVFALGATAHAILVVNQELADQRQRELIGALGGKLPPKTNWEMTVVSVFFIATGLLLIILFTSGVIPYRFDLASKRFVKVSRASGSPPGTRTGAELGETVKSATPPSIDGWSLAEVESTYGAAKYKDKTTGWAVWPHFKAHFEKGVVNAVEPLELP